MKILMLKDYFFPENCAGISLTEDLIEKFIERGHEVIVYTPTPTRGVTKDLRKKYIKQKKEIKENGQLKIYRYSLFKEYNNKFLRAIRYVLQNIIQILKAIKTEADIVFLGSTPPTMGIVGSIIKKIKKIPFVYNVQDIFPDSLVSTNISKENSLLWKIGNIISNISYKNSDFIITISNDMKENLISKGVDSNKIYVVPNWVNTDKISHIDRKDNFLIDELNLDYNNFYVVYAGNIGEAQNIEMIIRVAALLKEYKKIEFLIFGNGSKVNEIKESISINEISNVKLFSLRSKEEVSEVYSLGNISIISCKKGIGHSGVPSKTWNIIATQTPLIVCFDKEAELSQLILENDLGLVVEPNDDESLKQQILRCYFDNSILQNISKNQYNYKKHISHNVMTEKYEKILKKSVTGGKSNESI